MPLDSPRRVLVVAYYFPPMGLSGVQRVAKFVKYLPQFGWQVDVLTVEPGGYFAFDPSLLYEVEASGARLHRTTSWDPTRLFGRRTTVKLPREEARRRLAWLSSLLLVPDNKIGWFPAAVRAGRRLLQAHSFDAILSSAPPYTAHLVAATLSRWSGLPLLLDFRDDWVGNPRHDYPTPLHRALHRVLERWTLQQACCVTSINAYICEAIMARQSERCPVCEVLPQGYDPQDFEDAPVESSEAKMRLVYSGVFYDVQTPDSFLHALALLLARRPEARLKVEAVFVGLVPTASRDLVRRLGLESVVRIVGYQTHREAVAYLQCADVLWMTVGRRSGAETISTSKLFEYLGTRKPILALVPEGAVADLLRGKEAAWLVPPDDVQAIGEAMEALFDQWQAGTLSTFDAAFAEQFDREHLTGTLASKLEAICAC